MKIRHVQLLLALALLFPAAWAHAVIGCSINSPGFSTSYYPTDVSTTTVQSYFTVTCARGDPVNDPTAVTYSVGVDNGQNFRFGSNRASRGRSRINYDLYSTSACSTLWTNTPPAGTLPVPGTGTMMLSGTVPTSVDTAYWGCIPPGQNRFAGSYTDSVVMTLYYNNGTSAATSAGALPVFINVSAGCSISTPPGSVTFDYTSFGSASNPTTNFGVTCNSGLPYTLGLDLAATGTVNGTLLGLSYSLALSTTTASGSGGEQMHTITGNMAGGQAGTCAAGTCLASKAHTLIISY